MEPNKPASDPRESGSLFSFRTPACSARNLPLLEFLACVIEGRTALYVSTPITTGLRFLEWVRKLPLVPKQDATDLEREVIEPNSLHGRHLVHRVRARFCPSAVIDPTAVRLPGWEQGDYHELWGQVIQRYAKTVVFGDGWQYSQGCAYEFLIAWRSQAEVLDERFEPLASGVASRLIQEAVVAYDAVKVETRLLTAVLAQLASVVGSEAAR